jgi:hypothetical protein
VVRGVWCLFRMGSAESVKPAEFFSRDTGDLPLELNLGAPGWSLVTLQGANQRGWAGPVQLDAAKVERWVASAIAESGVTYVTALAQKVAEQHGAVPEHAILDAVEKLRQSDRLMTYSGHPEQQEKPVLIHGKDAILQRVQPTEVIIAPAEAAKRGWVRVHTPQFKLTGRESAQKLMALLPRIGSLYTRGARSPVKLLDLWDLEIQGGGRLRLTLEDVPPEAMKRLGELLEVLVTVVKQGTKTEGDLEIDAPSDQCLFIQALKQDGKP